jgi:hypothetical protein
MTAEYSAEDIDRLTETGRWLCWKDMDDDQRLAYVLSTPQLDVWEQEEVLDLIRRFAVKPHQWLKIKHAYKKAGGSPVDLDKIATVWRHEAGVPVHEKAERITGDVLLREQQPPLVWVVEEILPAGCTVFTGKSKDGKSLAAYDLAVSIVSNGLVWGRYPVASGSVWFLALEDGKRRAQTRLQLMQDRMETALAPEALRKLSFTLWKAPRLREGLEEQLVEWIESTADARLIIVDILEKVRPPRKAQGYTYTDDYTPTAILTELAQERNVAILVLHHANKANHEDFRDSASGCMSLIGGADNYWSLRRMPRSEEATLSITGRDVEEQQLAMQFKDGYWTVLGESALVKMSAERQALIAVLQEQAQPLTPKQVATLLGKTYTTTKNLLLKMLHAGVLFQPVEGRYALSPSYLAATVVPVVSVDSVVSVVSVVSERENGGETTGRLRPDYGQSVNRSLSEPLDNKEVIGINGARDHGDYGDYTPCYLCHGITYWMNAGGQRVCARCHPRFLP